MTREKRREERREEENRKEEKGREEKRREETIKMAIPLESGCKNEDELRRRYLKIKQ